MIQSNPADAASDLFSSKLASQLLATVGALVAGILLLFAKEWVDRRREAGRSRRHMASLLKQSAHELRFNIQRMRVFMEELRRMRDGLKKGANYFFSERYTLHPQHIDFLRKELARLPSAEVSVLNDLGHVHYQLAQVATHMQVLYDDDEHMLEDRLDLNEQLLEELISEFEELALDLDRRSKAAVAHA